MVILQTGLETGRDPPRFPVIAITRATYATLFANVARYLRVALPCTLLLLAGWASYQLVDPSEPPPIMQQAFTRWFAVEAIIFLSIVLAPAIVAVAWHRYLLLGSSAPAARSAVYARCALRIALFMFLLAFLPNNVYLGAKASGWTAISASALYAAVLTLAWFLISRWALALPALAIGAAPASFSASWKLTKGNALGVFAGCTLLVASIEIIYRATQLFLGGAIGTLGFPSASAPAAALLSVVTWTLAAGLFATYFSLAYQVLAQPSNADAISREFS
jgi:hypothetical protein